jgi:hypothetical protein
LEMQFREALRKSSGRSAENWNAGMNVNNKDCDHEI